MVGYRPIKITGNATGLVQEREEFLLPDDAYPVLQNAYVWRERIKRKQAYQLLGRLQRSVTVNNALTAGSINLITALSLQATASIVPGSINLVGGTDGTTYTDPTKNGTLTATGGSGTGGSINYATGVLTITAGANENMTGTIQYFPGLPVMGLRIRENQDATFYQTIAFDQVYAYNFNGTTWQEFIPGTTWNANGSSVSGTNFFWTTNYWVGDGNKKIFWVTNYSGITGDPIRYTNGSAWANFSPQIDASGNLLTQCLCLLPFRGRLVAFNTLEGMTLGTSKIYSNRIRWAAIGTPFTVSDGSVVTTNFIANAWRSDVRGQGGFLDIPTSEDIVSVGFVRDNLVIYCERSTWQLRYTGRTIAPFQIEKVNSENGAEGTFSTIQFDTSLVGIGDKGILECDSYKSELIDIKIPDLVFQFQNANSGPERVHGIRDFVNRLAYWTIPSASANGIFPDQRLVYNYENDSWATFNDSLTCLGTIQIPTSRTWINTHKPWIQCNFPWISEPLEDPVIIGGNQQGFVERLDELTTNDISLFIQNITGNTTTPTVITSPNHNMQTGFVIQISGIPDTTPFANLNAGNSPSTGLPYNAFNGIYGIVVLTANTFQLFTYNSTSGMFSSPQLDAPGVYVGTGNIAIRENFNIVSKKFNFMEEGQNIQMGYLDILMDSSESDHPGAISLNVYVDYNTIDATNILPYNTKPDTVFNTIIPTTTSSLNNKGGTKFWQRVICATRGSFLTLQYTFSNAQMAGIEQTLDVQIDAQVLWVRPAGRMTQI
jgi:hypothetical protein